MNRKEILLATATAYITLAQKLQSQYYWRRVRETFQLLRREE